MTSTRDYEGGARRKEQERGILQAGGHGTTVGQLNA